jgi:hypothetical protein
MPKMIALSRPLMTSVIVGAAIFLAVDALGSMSPTPGLAVTRIALAKRHGRESGHRVTPSLASCVVRDRNGLRARDAGSFATMIDGVTSSLPSLGGRPGGRQISQDGFLAGREKGLIATIALHGRYRAAENRWAEEHNYPLMKWPYVPLTGLVVRANPRKVLEVYEEDYVFRSDPWARAWLRAWIQPGSQAAQQGTLLRSLPALGDETVGFKLSLGPGNGNEEAIGVITQTGVSALEIAVQGGKRLRVKSALRIARRVETRLTRACPRVRI